MVNSSGPKPTSPEGVPAGEDPAVLTQAPLLARLSLTRPIFVTSIVILTLFVGLLSYFKLGVDLFPEIEIPVVTVQIPYRGAGPAEIETLVVKPVEDELASLAGMKRILASCDDGVGTITCQFYDGTDMKDAEQQVRNRVQNIRNKLPKEIDEPIILRVNLSDQAVIQVALEADLPPAQLYDLANEELKNRFAQVPGVGKVDLVGGRKREIEVLLDRNLLKRMGLSATRVTGRIADSSSNVPVGKVTKDGIDLNFRTLGEYRTVPEIEDAVVSFTDRPVRVKDVGTVVDSLEDAKSLAYVNGHPAIVFQIFKQTGTNTVKVVDGVQALLTKMNAEIKDSPGKPSLKPLQDGSVWIRQNVDDVQETIAIGVLLVIVVVYFFLGNFRSTFITALALPNSLIGAFLLMHLAGFTINIMTLLALSLSVGLLIDDAIVVRENIFRHIERGESPWKAALLGTREVNLAVLATSSVVIAVFLPVGFLSGTVGKFLGQFGLTMCFAMVISLFDALTIAPMLSAFFAGKGEKHRARMGSFTWGGALVGGLAVGLVGLVVAHSSLGHGLAVLFGALLGGLAPGCVGAFETFQEALEHSYGRLIGWVVDHRLATVLAALVVFIGSFVAAAHVTNTFIPQSDNPEFAVGLEMPVGASLEATGAVALQVDAVVRAHKEVQVTSVTGQGNTANIYVGMTPADQRAISSEDLKTILRGELAKRFSQYKVTIGDYDPAGSGQKPFTLILKGDDLAVMSAYAEKLKVAVAKAVPGLADLDTNYREGKPEYQIRLDPLKAGRLGVSTVVAGQELRNFTDGTVAGQYREDGKEYDIRVRLKEDQRDLEKGYASTWVPNLNNDLVRLSSVAVAQRASGPSSITRRDRSRSIVIDADLGQGAGLGDVLDATRKVIKANPLPKGVTYDFVGQAEDFADMGKNMLMAFMLAIVMMYLVLASLYESFITPLTILLALPLAIAGAFYALFTVEFLSKHGFFALLYKFHLFHITHLDGSLNLFSLIGLVMLLGLVAKNSILLVDLTLQHIRSGMERKEALVNAGKERLRPILMTSLALLFGTLPLALALNEAGRFRSSMGVAIVGGLFTSTLLTLVVVPAAFEYIDDIRAFVEGWVLKLGGKG
ncbi:MAG TPA: efflux RND transporter permease subunit [bacterium]|jgi:HAE1 family hydrophobic/amphiphilic exporter-1|nr:efflux RND transporter permease subunit [bacterium]